MNCTGRDASFERARSAIDETMAQLRGEAGPRQVGVQPAVLQSVSL